MDRQDRPPKTSGSPEPIPGRCGAKIRGTNPPRFCKKWPIKNGNGRCERCGGKSLPPGPTHPRYSTGRYSKYLPAPVAARVNESLSDPQLLSIKPHAALLDARFTMLMERLHTGESGSLWESLNKAWAAFQEANREIRECRQLMQAIAAGDPDAESKTRRLQDRLSAAQHEAAASIERLGGLIGQGNKDERSWRELVDLSHEVVATKSAEFGRLAKLQQLMTAEEVLAMIHSLQLAIVDVLTDENVKTKDAMKLRGEISSKILRLLPGRVESGDSREGEEIAREAAGAKELSHPVGRADSGDTIDGRVAGGSANPNDARGRSATFGTG